VIQITPQMRILVAIDPVDGRKGIEIKQNAYVLVLSVPCCGHGANLALPRARDRQ
jgi:hypothetical protein